MLKLSTLNRENEKVSQNKINRVNSVKEAPAYGSVKIPQLGQIEDSMIISKSYITGITAVTAN